MSTRIRDRSIGPILYTHEKTLNGVHYDQVVTSSLTDDEHMEDIVVPEFHKRIKAGDIINNPVVYVHSRKTSGFGYYEAQLLTGPYTYIAQGGSQTLYEASRWPDLDKINPSVHDGIVAQDMIHDARFRALGHVDSTPYTFLEDLAELRETMRFLSLRGGDLLKLATKFRSTVKRKLKGLTGNNVSKTDAITSSWLEYQFAFSPLVRSILDGVDYLHEAPFATRPKRRIARGKTEVSNSIPESIEKYFNPLVFDTFSKVSKREFKVHAGIIYEVTNPLNDFNFKLGTRIKDIPVTIWAVMPYSFMVDRIFDISTAIRGATNLVDPRVKILDGFTVTRDKLITELRHEDQVNPSYSITVNGDLFTDETFIMIRNPYTPGWVDTIPPFKIKELVNSLTKIADLFSLIAQRVSRF